MDFHIRRAELRDASALGAILRSIGYFTRINNEPPQVTEERISRHLALCQADESHSVYVAQTTTGEIAGYGAVHWLPYLILPAPEGYVSELFVHAAYQGQGVGSRLLETIKNEAQERGCYRLSLLNFRQRKSYQRQFYAKQGWEERADAANFVLYLPHEVA